jgi:hypothetical protein
VSTSGKSLWYYLILERMHTLLQFLKLAQDFKSETDILNFVDGESNRCLNEGDLLGGGEWLTSRLDYSSAEDANHVTAKALALWASPVSVTFSPEDLKDLVANLHLFDSKQMASAFCGIAARNPRVLRKHPQLLRDLAFRLRDDVRSLLGISIEVQSPLYDEATKIIRSASISVESAIATFKGTRCISARQAGIEVLKRCRHLRKFLLPGEQPLMSQVDLLLGVTFRELCQSYERSDTQKVILRLPDIRLQAQDIVKLNRHDSSVIWQSIVKPIAEHLLKLADEAGEACKLALTPSLKLSSTLFKVNLKKQVKAFITARVVNDGVGSANSIQVSKISPSIELVSPSSPFDLAAGSDRIVQLGISAPNNSHKLEIAVPWQCKDVSGNSYQFLDNIQVDQQSIEPDWTALCDKPPYSVNPIRSRNWLFGREAQLDKLLLHASAGTSTFVWGQKRVGKTSLLQVVQSELSNRQYFKCLFLRMGQLAAMHEGQLAHAIAYRIVHEIPDCQIDVPTETEFGAGLGRLIPFVETLTTKLPKCKRSSSPSLRGRDVRLASVQR